MSDMRPLFVVFEGIDRVGKNTQADLLVERLSGAGQGVRKLTSPDYLSQSGIIISRLLRGVVRASCPGGPVQVPRDDAVLLSSAMIVNRYEVASRVRLALELGEHVACSRWWQSAVLYGAQDGLDEGQLRSACACLPQPDLAVLLDADVERVENLLDPCSRYEANIGVQHRLVQAYRQMWAEHAGDDSWSVIAADSSPLVLADRVWDLACRARPELGGGRSG